MNEKNKSLTLHVRLSMSKSDTTGLTIAKDKTCVSVSFSYLSVSMEWGNIVMFHGG